MKRRHRIMMELIVALAQTGLSNEEQMEVFFAAMPGLVKMVGEE